MEKPRGPKVLAITEADILAVIMIFHSSLIQYVLMDRYARSIRDPLGGMHGDILAVGQRALNGRHHGNIALLSHLSSRSAMSFISDNTLTIVLLCFRHSLCQGRELQR